MNLTIDDDIDLIFQNFVGGNKWRTTRSPTRGSNHWSRGISTRAPSQTLAP